jgi:tetratricopeptide (TPR) repeat protein
LPLGNVTAFTLTRCVGAIMGNPGANGVVSEALAQGSYYAFISYSHRDSAEAARIHKALETYRLPPKVGGSVRRLFPIFRDREELSAGGDLSVQVQAALAASQALIVLCSPDAAASQWVGKEIETFRALYPDRPILAALIAGEPDAAFHSALTENGVREPVAADFRKGGDGRRLAQLKLVAGMTGLGLDALVQRDAQRQFRRVTAITLASAAAVLAMAVLLVFALRAQSEAERQRAEAEGLVEYMLTDLRDRLKGVGRLDVMTAVNERAMAYYGKQGDLTRLPDESLSRRSRVIEMMAADDEAAGKTVQARRRYVVLSKTTSELLASAPDAPNRIFAHANALNRLGLLDFGQNRFKQALPPLREARNLLDRIVDQKDARESWIKTSSYVHANLCASSLGLGDASPQTLRHCQQAVAQSRVLKSRPATAKSAAYDLVFHLFWLSKVYAAQGQHPAAIATLHESVSLVDSLGREDPKNLHWREQRMLITVQLAQNRASLNQKTESLRLLREALTIATGLTKTDPHNAYWQESLANINQQMKEIEQ